MLSAHDRAKNCVFAAQHFCSLCEVTFFDCLTNRCAADDLIVPKCNSWNPDNLEVKFCTQLSKKGEVASPVFSKRPFVADADFTQRSRILHQLLYEIFRLRRSKRFVEFDDEQVL